MWLVVQCMKRKKLDKIYTGLSFCLYRLLLSSIQPSLQCGCWWIRYKTKEVIWTKVTTNLVGNFCSFSESKCTEPVTLLAAIQQTVHTFTSIAHLRTIALAMRLYTQNVATPTIILNFREEISVIRSQIMKFMKILCHENLELYGISPSLSLFLPLHPLSPFYLQATIRNKDNQSYVVVFDGSILLSKIIR